MTYLAWTEFTPIISPDPADLSWLPQVPVGHRLCPGLTLALSCLVHFICHARMQALGHLLPILSYVMISLWKTNASHLTPLPHAAVII